MTEKKRTKTCHESARESSSCCKVESITRIDDRGQMVLPKEIREKAKIRAGDKLAVLSMEKNGEVCCISLIKVKDLAGKVKDLLGPLMEDILAE